MEAGRAITSEAFPVLTKSDLVFGVILPFALATVILAIAWRPWKRSRGAPALWGGPLACGLAFAATFALLQGPSHLFPPNSAIMWLFFVAIGFTLLGLIDALVSLPRVVRALLLFAAAAGGAGLLLKFNFTNQTWDAVPGALWLAAIAATTVFWWASFEQSAAGASMAAPLAMGATSGVSALIVAVLVEQTTGQALGAMTIALGVAVVLMAWSGKATAARGTAMVVAGIGVSALVAAYFISSLPLQYVLLLGIAPATLWIGRVPAIRRLRPTLRVIVQIAILLIPLVVAAVLAVLQARHDATMGSDPYV
jgi:hypothetical protein